MAIPRTIPQVERFGPGTVEGKMGDVAMDSAEWWAPTSIDEEQENGGTTRANAPAGRGGTRHPAKFMGGNPESGS